MGVEMDANAWANQYLGQQIGDNSRKWVGECVSFIKRYAQEAQDVPNADSVLYVPEDKAKNMWLKFTPAMAVYYDKVPVPKVGDIAVYNGGKYGDVAVYIGTGRVVGQLGTPVFKPVAIRPVGSPIGYLRRKGDDMLTQGAKDKYLKMGFRREPTAAELQDPKLDDGNFLADHVWNNGGEQNYLHGNDALNAQVADLTKKLEIAQAANGDATRWQTLKALIKQLIS